MIDVVHEGVERAHTLLDAGFELAPLGVRDDARNDVERDQPLGRFFGAIDVEGDAGAPEERFGFGALGRKVIEPLRAEPFGQRPVGLPDALSVAVHLVECCAHSRPR